jgi:hypothetical protein
MHIKILLPVFFVTTFITAAPIKHKFVAIDEGRGNLLYVNEYDTTTNWTVAIGKSGARDMQLIGNNRVLIGHDGGYLEFNLANGAILKTVTGFGGTMAARRQANGHTLISGLNLNGSTGVVLLDVDSLNAIKNKIVFPGDYVRLMRQTAKGTYLFSRDTMIQEGDNSGNYIWQARVAGFSHAWKSLRLPSGNTLISAGYGGFMVEVDKNAAIVRKFGKGSTTTPDSVKPNFFAMFQLLKNGDIVVANWQGHGDGHGASGIQMLEYDPAGNIVWFWKRPTAYSSLQGVIVLDSLNTNLLHDERNGIMEPLSTGISQRSENMPFPESKFRVITKPEGVYISTPDRERYAASLFSLNGAIIGKFDGIGTGFIPFGQKSPGIFLLRTKIGREIKTEKINISQKD